MINKFKYIITHILSHYLKSIYVLKKYIIKNKLSKLETSKLYVNYSYYFNKIVSKVFKNISIIKSNEILILLLNNHTQIKSVLNKFNNIIQQSGGFFYNKYDSVFTKILNIFDVIIDLLTLVPNTIFTTSLNHILGPFQLIAMFLNLSRGDYMLSFFSFISMIPGIGTIVGPSLKLISRLVEFIHNKNVTYQQEKEIDNVLNMRHMYKLEDFDPLRKYTKWSSLNDIENEDLIIS